MPWGANWREQVWSSDDVVEMYRRMRRIRCFEEEGDIRYTRGDFVGPYHSSIGQEATCVGATFSLTDRDSMTSNHRAHGHQIAMGAALPGLAAEIWGKHTGVCKGKGGSMHMADFSVGALGASGLLGGGAAIAVGAALAGRIRETDSVVVCFFGDGAANEGIMHEAMNWASVWNLPVLFVCENNLYALTMWSRDTTSVDLISKRASAYSMPGWTVDGQNVLEVDSAIRTAVDRARRGDGPSLVECITYRYTEHSLRMVIPKDRDGALASGSPYRTDWEIEQWKHRDPLAVLRAMAEGLSLDVAALDAVDDEEQKAAAAAWSFAEESPWPPESEIWSDTWPEPVAVAARPDLHGGDGQ